MVQKRQPKRTAPTKGVSISEFRNCAAQIINRVAHAGKRIVLWRRGKPVAALISVEDLELLRKLEDRADLLAIKEAREEPGDDIPYEEIRRELGL